MATVGKQVKTLHSEDSDRGAIILEVSRIRATENDEDNGGIILRERLLDRTERNTTAEKRNTRLQRKTDAKQGRIRNGTKKTNTEPIWQT